MRSVLTLPQPPTDMEQFRLKWNKSTGAAADLQFLLGATGWLWRGDLLHPVCLESCSLSRLSWDGRGKVSILLDKLPARQFVGLGRFTIWRKLFPDFKDWELVTLFSFNVWATLCPPFCLYLPYRRQSHVESLDGRRSPLREPTADDVEEQSIAPFILLLKIRCVGRGFACEWERPRESIRKPIGRWPR